jgi:hypothetical protein
MWCGGALLLLMYFSGGASLSAKRFALTQRRAAGAFFVVGWLRVPAGANHPGGLAGGNLGEPGHGCLIGKAMSIDVGGWLRGLA